MHERLEGLKVSKMIPCNCTRCAKATEPHFYRHELLQRLKTDSVNKWRCEKSYEEVSVAGLLDGLFAKHIQNPKQLLEAGEIEEALRIMPQTNETAILLGQIVKLEKDRSLGLCKEEDYRFERTRILKAAFEACC